MTAIATHFRSFPARYLGRPWTEGDGLADPTFAHPVSASLRAFYCELGSCDELLTMYNEFVSPDEVVMEDGHLVFAHENQDVVSWGFAIADLDSDNPTAWQRNDDEQAWASEEKTLAPFLEAMFDWVTGTEGEDN